MDKYGDLLQHERLTAYIDGELSPEEFVAMEAELEAHPELQDLLMELRGVRDVMARIGPVKAPPSLFGSVNDSVDLASARQARRYSVWNSLGTPIMMVMMAATFLFVMSNVQRDLASVAEKEREKQAEVAAAEAAREVRMEAARAAPPAAPAGPGSLGSGPIHMAPDGYRFTGPGSFALLTAAVQAVGGRMVGPDGASVTAVGPDGYVTVELDASKAGAFRAAMENKVTIEPLGMGRVVSGTFNLRIFVGE